MKDSNSSPKVIIIGFNYGSILTMVRDLGRAGYDVYVLRVFRKTPGFLNILGKMAPERESIYVKDHRTCIMDGKTENIRDAILDLRSPSSDDRPLLIPVDDFLVSAIDLHYDELKDYFVIPNVGDRSLGITELMDKDLQKRMAEKAGLDTLKSTIISLGGNGLKIPEDTPYPCFIKPNVSTRGSKLIMKKCLNREELLAALSSAHEGEGSVMAEEYKDIRNEYSMLGAVTEEGAVISGVFRAVMRGNRERKGVAVTGEVLDPSGWEDLMEASKTFTESTGYRGMFDLDFIEDENGKIFFTEMNFRAGASVHALTDEKNDLPAMFAGSILKGEPMDTETRKINTGKVFVSEKALLEEYVRNDIDYSALKDNLNNADIFFIKDPEDPRPYEYFRRYIGKARALRFPYRVRDGLKK